MQVLSRGFLMSTMLTNPKQNKVSIIQAMKELSQSLAQHGRNIVGSYTLRSFAHRVGCEWLGVVEQSLKPVKRLSQQLPTFLLFRACRKGCLTMLDPFAQLFQL